MKTILEHELDLHDHSFVSYLFGAFLLEAVGLGSLLYNINNALANFEYVLGTICLVYILLIPILTMRSISEERRQKTDQLLYSLPLSMSEIVVGKFLALAIILFIPIIFICLYPWVFSWYGNVYLLTSYGTIFAFFLLGCALIAIGMFVSSLTEKQGVSAVITAAIIILLYYGAKVMPTVMEYISPFQRFYNFVNGIFDLNTIVYYGTIIVFFLFMTVQSMEKRRYS